MNTLKIALFNALFLIVFFPHSALSELGLKEEFLKLEGAPQAFSKLENKKDLESYDFANMARFAKEAKDTALALALIEESLYRYPLSLEARRLRTEVLSHISSEAEEVPFLLRILDIFPFPLLILLLLAFFVLLASNLGLFFKLKNSYSDLPTGLTLKVLALTLGSILLSLALLYKNSHSSSWACVSSAGASLYSGPSVDLAVQRSLPAGSCHKIEQKKENWFAIDSQKDKGGWVSASEMYPLRVTVPTAN